MRVPLRELEDARRDPIGYRERLATPGEDRFSWSRYMALQYAVFRFHRSREDAPSARQYLEHKLESFKSQDQTPEVLALFDSYVTAFRSLGHRVIAVADTLSLPLPSHLHGWTVTGRIPRLDHTAVGYGAWLFAKEPGDWRSELRLPLVQAGYAARLGVPTEEVTVGVYSFSSGTYTDYNYAPEEIAAAQTELFALLRQLTGQG